MENVGDNLPLAFGKVMDYKVSDIIHDGRFAVPSSRRLLPLLVVLDS